MIGAHAAYVLLRSTVAVRGCCRVFTARETCNASAGWLLLPTWPLLFHGMCTVPHQISVERPDTRCAFHSVEAQAGIRGHPLLHCTQLGAANRRLASETRAGLAAQWCSHG